MQNPIKIAAAIAFLGLSTSFFIVSVDHYLAEKNRRDGAARAKGFSSSSEMDQATEAGFTDPAKWRADITRRQEEAKRAKAQADKISAEAKAAEEKSNREFQVAVQGAIQLREMMKNPDSFSLERVTQQSDGSLCYTYRAANSFNAIIPGQAVFSPLETAMTGMAKFPMLWSKHCKSYGREIENVGYALVNYYPRRK